MVPFICVIYLGYTDFLLSVTAVSAGLDVYKQEVGCKLQVPQLQGKADEIKKKQKKLILLKDAINLAWIAGERVPLFFVFLFVCFNA